MEGESRGSIINATASPNPGCTRSSRLASGGPVTGRWRRDGYDPAHRKNRKRNKWLRFDTIADSKQHSKMLESFSSTTMKPLALAFGY